MEIIGVPWLGATSTGDGKHPVKRFIQKYTTLNKWLCSSQKKGNLQYFVIFMDTVGKRIYLCMGVTSKTRPKNQDFFLFFYLPFLPSLFTQIVGLVIKKAKNQQLECLYSMILGKIHAYIP